MKHLLNILATWRLQRMIRLEDGPYSIFDKLRDHAQEQAFKDNRLWREVHEALQCQKCLSVWVGFVVALSAGEPLIYGFAYSVGSLVFDIFFKLLEDTDDD